MDCNSLETALLQHNSVVDCVVAQNCMRSPAFTAYLVLRGRLDVQALENHLNARLEKSATVIFIPVSRLPLSADGKVDQDALGQLRKKRELALAWEAELTAHPDIRRAAVVLEELERAVPALHLSDVLPDWQASSDLSTRELKAVSQNSVLAANDQERAAIATGGCDGSITK